MKKQNQTKYQRMSLAEPTERKDISSKGFSMNKDKDAEILSQEAEYCVIKPRSKPQLVRDEGIKIGRYSRWLGFK